MPAPGSRVWLAPSGVLATYVDPAFGFSFDYPANWHLRAPGPGGAAAPPDGHGVGLTNSDPFDQADAKRAAPPDEVRDGVTIELGLRTDIVRYASLDAWIAERPRLSPALEVADVRHATVGGLPARRWRIRGPRVANGEAVQAGVVQGDRLYLFGATPAASRQLDAFDRLLESFRLPMASPGSPADSAR